MRVTAFQVAFDQNDSFATFQVESGAGEVHRRYSEFQALRCALVREGHECIPQLPRQTLFRSKKAHFLRERTYQLDEWIRAISSHSTISFASRAFKQFSSDQNAERKLSRGVSSSAVHESEVAPDIDVTDMSSAQLSESPQIAEMGVQCTPEARQTKEASTQNAAHQPPPATEVRGESTQCTQVIPPTATVALQCKLPVRSEAMTGRSLVVHKCMVDLRAARAQMLESRTQCARPEPTDEQQHLGTPPHAGSSSSHEAGAQSDSDTPPPTAAASASLRHFSPQASKPPIPALSLPSSTLGPSDEQQPGAAAGVRRALFRPSKEAAAAQHCSSAETPSTAQRAEAHVAAVSAALAAGIARGLQTLLVFALVVCACAWAVELGLRLVELWQSARASRAVVAERPALPLRWHLDNAGRILGTALRDYALTRRAAFGPF